MMQQKMSRETLKQESKKSKKSLKNAEVVVEDEVDLDKINVGCKVKVHDYEFDEDMELKIVGSTEANSPEGKISNESPVGKALIGAHTGDVVEVEMPMGIMKYKVLEIQRKRLNKSKNRRRPTKWQSRRSRIQNQLLKVRREKACRFAGKWQGPVSDHKI